MMLAELRSILGDVPADASHDAYGRAILDDNVLGKATRTTRERTAQRLTELYILDPTSKPYHVFRRLWSEDLRNQPMLALLMACWRDPLLRQLTPFVIELPAGHVLTSRQTVEQLKQVYPQRFGENTLASVARNLAASWTLAGYLGGKVKKSRSRPHVTPLVTSFALFLGYLRGGRGDVLLDSPWSRLLERSRNELIDLAAEASKQGWIRYKAAGAVTEITFPAWQAAVKEAG